jgi:hypothetical protein
VQGLGAFFKPVLTVAPRPEEPEEKRYVRSYLWTRILVGALGIALPPLLAFVDGLWFDGDPFPRTSLSDYYYSGARELFVGVLCAVGVFLITYKVAEKNLDNTLSCFAGGAAAAVALFPTNPPGDVALTSLQERLGESVVAGIHYGAAALFITSLGVLSFCFGIREGKPDSRPQRRSRKFWRWFHWGCAGVIALALLWMLGDAIFEWGPRHTLFIGETVSVLAFAVSWLLKGAELDMLRGPLPPREAAAP